MFVPQLMMANNMTAPNILRVRSYNPPLNSNNNNIQPQIMPMKSMPPNIIMDGGTSPLMLSNIAKHRSLPMESNANPFQPQQPMSPRNNRWKGMVLWKRRSDGKNAQKTDAILTDIESMIPPSKIEQQRGDDGFLTSIATKIRQQNEYNINHMIFVVTLSNYVTDHQLIRKLRQIVHSQEVLLYNYKNQVDTDWTEHYVNITVVNKKVRLLQCIRNSYLFYMHHS